MVKGIKINFRETGMLAAVLTAGVFAVSWLFSNLLNTAVKPLFASVPVVSGITATAGEKVLGFISGIVPTGDFFGLSGVLTIYISAFLVVIVGEYIIDNLRLPAFKSFLGMNSRIARLASIILYGAIPAYLILVGFTIPNMMTVIGLIIHAFATATISVFIASMLKLKI